MLPANVIPSGYINAFISSSQPHSWKVVLWARGSPQAIVTLLLHKNGTTLTLQSSLEPFLSSAGRI